MNIGRVLIFCLLLSLCLGQIPRPSRSPLPRIPSTIPSGLVPSGLIPSGLIPSGLIPSGLIPTIIPSTIPSGLIPSGSIPTAIPSINPSTIASLVPSFGASNSPIANLPSFSTQASQSPSSQHSSPSPPVPLTLTITQLAAFTDETCGSRINAFLPSQVAYFGALIEVSTNDGITSRTLHAVCFQKGSNADCVPVTFDSLPAASSRDPVFSVDLTTVTLEVGDSYTVKASVEVLMVDQTSQTVTVSTTFTAEEVTRDSTQSDAHGVAPAWIFTVCSVLLVGMTQLW